MDVFDLDGYSCRQKVLAITGKVLVHDGQGALVAYSKQKALKLREDIRIYADESEATLLVVIKARQILDIGATYDVTTAAGAPIGALRRKAIKSIVKDQWLVLGPGDAEWGSIDEDGTLRALARRFVPLMNLLLAQEYGLGFKGRPAAAFKRNHNPFVSKLQASVEPGLGRNERMLTLAAAVLLLLIEGKQR